MSTRTRRGAAVARDSRRSAATARSTSWWPFSHTSRPGETTTCSRGADPRPEREERAIDPRRRNPDALLGRALDEQGGLGALGGGEEEIGLGQHQAPVATRANVAIGVEEGHVSHTVSTSL